MAEVHILSYFSLDTDLAGEMRSWSEFCSGAGYTVELESADGSEIVSVSLAPERAVAPDQARRCARAAIGLASRHDAR